MNRRIDWGAGILILLLIAGGAFLYYSQYQELKQLIQESAEADKLLEEKNKPIADTEPPDAREGFKMVKYRGYWHEVSIHASEDNWQELYADRSAATEDAVIQTYTGPLTYHEELLKTNPVKALKLQAEERGHVNAKWIPSFPPDDTEAQELAKAVYIFIYNKNSDTPKLGIAGNSMLMMREIDKKYPGGTNARRYDLKRLTWVNLDFPMGQYNLPSDYFPRKNPYADAFMKYGNSLIKQGDDTEAEQR